MKINILSVVVGALGFFLLAIPAQGATSDIMRAYFSASTTTVPIGGEVSVSVFIDASLPVNAYAFTVNYPPTMLDFVASDNSRSLIDVWQTTPLISASTISFKGGSLKPFQGDHGELLTFHFRTKSMGDATFSFQNISLYLANGKGTKVIPSSDILALHIVPGGSAAPQDVAPGFFDHIPPTIKYLAFIANPYDTHEKLLGFQVADVGSGIKQVFLRTRPWFLWTDFEPAINPTAISQGVWMAQLRVIDNAGNITNATIFDWSIFERGPLLVILFILLIFGSAIRALYRHVLRKKNQL